MTPPPETEQGTKSSFIRFYFRVMIQYQAALSRKWLIDNNKKILFLRRSSNAGIIVHLQQQNLPKDLSDMENLVEKMRRYFETTSREKVLEDWEKTKEFDQIGPLMDDFLSHSNFHFKIKLHDPIKGHDHIINCYSPKFSSDFFLNKSCTSCNQQHFQL